MARRRRSKYIRSTLIPLKLRKPKPNVLTCYTFVGGPWNGQTAKLHTEFRETSEMKCGKCGCVGKYKRGEPIEKKSRHVKGGVIIKGYALHWWPA